MENIAKGVFGEVSLTKVAGLFSDKSQAEATATALLRMPGMVPAQVRVLGPQDAKMSRRDIFGRNLEPEQHGIFKTLLITHGIFGLLGAAAGVLLFLWLYHNGQPMVAGSPRLAFGAIVGFATAFGLMLGGLITIRPDHVWLIASVRSSLKKNKWAVIVHPVDSAQTSAASELLRKDGAEILKTL